MCHLLVSLFQGGAGQPFAELYFTDDAELVRHVLQVLLDLHLLRVVPSPVRVHGERVTTVGCVKAIL